MSNSASTIQSALELARSGKLDQAINSLRRAVQQSPRDAKLNNALGIMLLTSGQAAQGEFYLVRATELSPTAGFLGDLGNAVFAQGRVPEATDLFRRSLALDPNYWQSSLGLIQTLTRSNEPEEAAEFARKTAAQHPALVDAYDMGARALILAGRIDEAVELARRGLKAGPANARILATLAVSLTYSDKANAAELTDIYRSTGRALMSRVGPPPSWRNPRDPSRRLRVGYFSPDFRAHSVGYFIEPILQHHDPAEVEAVCYYTGSNPDAATQRMKELAHRWVELGPNRSPEWIARIRNDQVDILVELSGHSHGNCLPMLAQRLAPIQATYLGWPATTGLPTMDWRIVDAITDPPGSESACIEKLARLDGCFLCYRPPDAAPEPAPGPLGRGEPVTFGSFNAPFKISDTTVDLWSRLLQSVPHSRLLLKASGLARAPLSNFLRERFESRGIGADRLTLLDYIDDAGGHLGAYSRIDIALDTIPYGGTTTTCEALWMGVPVITLTGSSHAARVGTSILTAAGLTELVAASPDELVSIGAALARDPARLAALRRSLRGTLRASPLLDGAGQARRLEAAYRMMWQKWCEGSGAML